MVLLKGGKRDDVKTYIITCKKVQITSLRKIPLIYVKHFSFYTLT